MLESKCVKTLEFALPYVLIVLGAAVIALAGNSAVECTERMSEMETGLPFCFENTTIPIGLGGRDDTNPWHKHNQTAIVCNALKVICQEVCSVYSKLDTTRLTDISIGGVVGACVFGTVLYAFSRKRLTDNAAGLNQRLLNPEEAMALER